MPCEDIPLTGGTNLFTTRAVICRIVGNRPSREDRQTLLQFSLQGEVGKILRIHFLGHGFYQLEKYSSELIRGIMLLNPLCH